MQLRPVSSLNLKRSVYLWNLMIRNSINNGLFTDSLNLYSSMVNSGVHGNNYTFPLLLKACANLHSILHGTILHSLAFQLGFQADAFVQTALIDMYSNCSNLQSACQVFDEMPFKSVVSWNSMISANCRYTLIDQSIMLFKQMQVLGFELSSIAFLSIFSVCPLPYMKQGLCLHCYVLKLGLHFDIPLSNSIITMYIRFNQINAARSVFNPMNEKSLVSWTTILGGYSSIGNVAEAFSIFSQMRVQSVTLDAVVFVNLGTGCVRLGNLLLAASVHSLILKSGCDREDPIVNLFVSMYAKCSDLVSAQRVFDMAGEKTVFLWTSLIGAYAHLGCPEKAFDLFKQMSRTSIGPNEVTVVTVLSACADMGSLSMGKEVEEYILLNGLESDLQVQTSLIHMYCKCGSLEKAKAVFERVSNKDLAVWSSMINGYAIHGLGEEALNLFHEMQSEEGIEPDAVIFTSILLACSHSGLVEHGLKYFQSMHKDFGIEPNVEHYSCLVDLVSRVGYFDLALKIIEGMPFQVEPQVWAPLLSACRTHQNYELGVFAAKNLLELDSRSTSNYVLVANLYTFVGKYKEAAAARKSIKERGLVKELGWSQIEIDGSLHVFTAGDQSRHQSLDIYRKLEELHVILLEAQCLKNIDADLHLEKRMKRH